MPDLPVGITFFFKKKGFCTFESTRTAEESEKQELVNGCIHGSQLRTREEDTASEPIKADKSV